MRNAYSLWMVLFIAGCSEAAAQDNFPTQSSEEGKASALSRIESFGSAPACSCLKTPVAPGTILMVMPDGSIGASSLRQVDGIVYSRGNILVTTGQNLSDAEIRALVASEDAAIIGHSSAGSGVKGRGGAFGVYGVSSGGYGVYGYDLANGNGVYGYAAAGTGIRGDTNTGTAVYGYAASGDGTGVVGWSQGNGAGVQGYSYGGQGVWGSTDHGIPGTLSPPGTLGAGWLDCPETGECGCPDGQYVAKTADRGARIFCAKL